MQNNNIAPEKAEPKYAEFGIRFFAYFIDNLFIGSIILIIKFLFFILNTITGFQIFTNQILFQYTGTDIILYICRVLYFVLLTYFTSATIGKHILKLKVVSTNNTGKYTFTDILYRETIGRFLSKFVLYAGYLLILVNKDKTALHDMLADTRVIYKNTEPKGNTSNDLDDNHSFEYIPIDENTNECSEQTDTNL